MLRLAPIFLGLVTACGSPVGGGTLPVPDEFGDDLVAAPTLTAALITGPVGSVDPETEIRAEDPFGNVATSQSTVGGAFALETIGLDASASLALSGFRDGQVITSELEIPEPTTEFTIDSAVPSTFEPDRSGVAITVSRTTTTRNVGGLALNLTTAVNSTDFALGDQDTARILIEAVTGERIAVVLFDLNDRSVVSEAVVVVF